jgi:hypothetical protein
LKRSSPVNTAVTVAATKLGCWRQSGIAVELARLTLLFLLRGVVAIKLVEAAAERQDDEQSKECKLGDVDKDASDGDLERAKMWVDGEQVDQLEHAEDVGTSEHSLRYEVGIERVPQVTWLLSCWVSCCQLFSHLHMITLLSQWYVTLYSTKPYIELCLLPLAESRYFASMNKKLLVTRVYCLNKGHLSLAI